MKIVFLIILFLFNLTHPGGAYPSARKAHTHLPFSNVEEHNVQTCTNLAFCGHRENHLRSEKSQYDTLICVCKK